MKIEVSDGEIVDKYSILCLKLERIHDEQKRKEVQHEKDQLHMYASTLIKKWSMYYDLVCYVNEQIWDKTNEIKSLHDQEKFAVLAHDIFSLNDQRYRLKRIFNTHSSVKEQKSYADKMLYLVISDYNVLLEKLDELIFMVLLYDKIHIQINANEKMATDIVQVIDQWFPSFCVVFDQRPDVAAINLESLNVFDPTAISIISQARRPVEPVEPDA